MRRTIFLAVTLLAAAFCVTTDDVTPVARQPQISAASPTYARLFQRWRSRHRSAAPETATPAQKPA